MDRGVPSSSSSQPADSGNSSSSSAGNTSTTTASTSSNSSTAAGLSAAYQGLTAASSSAAAAAGLMAFPSPSSLWTVHVCPSTGGQFDIVTTPSDTVETLARSVANKLRIPRERISLLHRDSILKGGTIQNNGVADGSKIVLIPNVESGLMTHKPEPSMAQALENLSETQVNDFLSGKSPLTLAMRLGDHMMFVQLQLSSTPPGSRRSSSSRGSSRGHSKHSSSSSKHRSQTRRMWPYAVPPPQTMVTPPPTTGAAAMQNAAAPSQQPPASFMLGATPTPVVTDHRTEPAPSPPHLIPDSGSLATTAATAASERARLEAATHGARHHPPAAVETPVAPVAPVPVRVMPGVVTPAAATLHPALMPLGAAAAQHVLAEPLATEGSHRLHQRLRELRVGAAQQHTRPLTPQTPASPPASPCASSSSDTSPCASPTPAGAVNAGAIIESMHHHGAGVYSGTFSGTLNPALQDKHGRPRRSIGTIVHILNDLLGATPQYRAHYAHAQSRYTHAQLAQRAHQAYRHYRRHRHHHRASEPRGEQVSPVDQERLVAENMETRSKMFQLQAAMEQRRARRQARRRARNSSAPYPTRGDIVTSFTPEHCAAPALSLEVSSDQPPVPEASMEVEVSGGDVTASRAESPSTRTEEPVSA